MSAGLATFIYALGILGIFLLDRDRTSRVSRALWIPVVWLSIGASRSVAQWLGMAPVLDSPDEYLEGSPLDRLIFVGLLVAGLIVLDARGRRTGALLRANGPLLAFFLYCAVSVLWSDYPLVAFKRLIKALGNLVMVLVVLSEPDAPAAIRRLLARSAFLLIPLSVLLVKYYPDLGRHYNYWTGTQYYSGVATEKNGLGIVCLVFGLGSLWQFLTALARKRPRMARPLVAHGAILAMTLWLLSKADSATSLACFLIGGTLIALTSWRGFALRPTAMHVLAVLIVSVCLLGLFLGFSTDFVQAMGRDATLTGRTQLWEDVLRMTVDPWLFGAGFESFWLGERVKSLWDRHWWHPNQAHNGYLEVFLNLGWIGVALLGFVIVWGYRNVVHASHRDPETGGLRLAFFVVAVLYNLTEAAFKVMHPVWIAFLLAVTLVPSLASPSRRQGHGAL